MSYTIGIIIGRLGGVDGVSLEVLKWIQVLERLGHKVHILSGSLEGKIPNVTVLSELNFNHPDTIKEQNHAFFRQNVQERPFLKRLGKRVDFIEKNILKWIIKNQIQLLISENATSLPCHLAMGMAIANVLTKTEIPCISHDHDFAWERGDRYRSRYTSVRSIIRKSFPIILPNVKHLVINTHAKQLLTRIFSLESEVIPNVMDFKKPFARKDSYNRKLRSVLKLHPKDILLFQITRVVQQKGIDTAIELIRSLDDKHVKLIITGHSIDDHQGKYLGQLKEQVRSYHLKNRVLFAGNSFRFKRGSETLKRPRFSLEDGYAQANACCFFSRNEGFGNGFVEAVQAKKPIFVNNYQPVFWPDIGSLGFETVMLEDSCLTDDAIQRIDQIIHSPKLSKEIAEHNFKLGLKYFSFEVLEQKLDRVLKQVMS